MYTKKVLLFLSFCPIFLSFAISIFIHRGIRHASPEGHGKSPGASRNAEPLNDLSPEVKSSLPLFHRLNENYTRGAEPASGGVRILQRLGIKTLLDLRSAHDHTDDVKIEAERLGLSYHWLPMSIWFGPSDAEAKKFLSLVADRHSGPFFVFCSDGKHRTGEMSAIYRIDGERWDIDRALKEMDEIGFSPYYYALRNYVWNYARKFRPEALPKTARRMIPTDEWDQKQDRPQARR